MRIRSLLLAIAGACVLILPAFAADAPPAAVFPPSNFDVTCSPCRDFDQYANGGWAKTHTIPGSMSAWGSFSELAERNQARLYELLEQAAADRAAKPNSLAGEVGIYYGTCMDSAAAEREGAKPLQPLLTAIDGMKGTRELAAQVAWLHVHGVRALFGFGASQDVKNSDVMIANASQGGLGLPDRDYYLKPDSASVATRREYTDHIVRSFQLIGIAEPAARTAAAQILEIETFLARSSYTNIQRRDPNANYHKLSVANLGKIAPAFDWTTYLAKRGGPKFDSLNVQQVTFFKGLDSLITVTPLPAWQNYLRWRAIEDAAPTLSSAFVQEDFRFARTQSGVTELQPRWKRCLRATDMALGDALGQIYVQKYYSQEARERALRMVHNLEAALADRLVSLEWMSEPTRQAARVKLAAFADKVGYPDKWRDYSAVGLQRGSFFANRGAVRAFESARQFGKIGRPTERGEWMMSPPTVNAFYIADLGGLALAYAALQKELAGKPAPARIDGFTAEQRFFLGYAQIWRQLQRPEQLRTQVNTNPHAPAHWRINGPLSNLDEFATAFDCKDGDPMVRKQELRARIW